MEIIDRPSPNFSQRTLPISMLVFHYTELERDEDAIRVLTNPSSNNPVSSHYLIGTNGTIYRLVDEGNRAWHAGASFWRGITDVNSASIGIEISCKGRDLTGKAIPFSNAAISSTIELASNIISRHNIKNYNIVGHSDVAPTRKQDPGELFPWQKLADNNIGIWTNHFSTPNRPINDMLSEIGYDITNTDAALRAFQMHYYPEAILNNAPSRTLERLAAISSLYQNHSR